MKKISLGIFVIVIIAWAHVAAAQSPELPPTQQALTRIALERLQVVRMRQEGQPAVASLMSGDSGMILQLRLTAPEPWQIVSLDGDPLIAVRDPKDRPMSARPIGRILGINTLGESPQTYLWTQGEKPNEKLLYLGLAAPLRSADRLGRIEIQCNVTLGKPARILIDHLPGRVGQTINMEPLAGEVIFGVEECGKDRIVLTGAGKMDRIVDFEFTGADGKSIEPYTRTSQSTNAPGGNEKIAKWAFDFIELPEAVGLNVLYYDPLRRERVVLTWNDVLLP